MKQPSFQAFALPPKLAGMSDIAYSALQLAALCSRLALEDRTLVTHITGRPENVAEHSTMLAIVAPGIAEQFYPDLDANLVARFATIHDAVEAYVGDTATYLISEAELRQKALREAEGLVRLKQDFAALPKFVMLVEAYEDQQVAEARFVRIIDKWTPILVHFADNGAALQAYSNQRELLVASATQEASLRTKYPDWADLVAVRAELNKLAAKHLF